MRTRMIFMGVWLLISGAIKAQLTSCQKEVVFDAVKTVSYSVNVDTDSISDYDLLRARPYITSFSKQKCIDDQGQINTVTQYDSPAYNASEWAEPIYEVRTYGSIVELYNKTGDFMSGYDPADYQAEGMKPLPAEAIEIYGLETVVRIPDEPTIDYLRMQGYEVMIKDQTALISGDSSEYFIDEENQITTRRWFHQGILTYEETQKVAPLDDEVGIPVFKNVCFVDELSNGSLMATCELTEFRNYTVDGVGFFQEGLISQNGMEGKESYQGLNSVDQVESGNSNFAPATEMTIHPNPANQSIRIGLPRFFGDRPVALKVVSIVGREILSIDELDPGSSHQVDVSDWADGIYIIKSGYDDNWVQKRFVKQ